MQFARSTSALGTPEFWKEAARVVSGGVYIGSKPMHLQAVGKTYNAEVLWQRLR